MSQLIMPVSETLTSYYIVATSKPPPDPFAIVPWKVPEPYRAPAIEAMKTPRMTVALLDAAESVINLDGLCVPDRERELMQTATHHLVVLHQAQVTEQPYREQMARAVARALADSCADGGVLVDPNARHVIFRNGRAAAERGWFRMGDQWFGLSPTVSSDPDRPDPRTDPEATRKCSCLRMDLLGMHRFGLPGLFIRDMPCASELALLNLLRSVAARLVTDHWRALRLDPTRRELRIDDHQTIDRADFWRYWGATPFLDAGGPALVRLVPHGPTVLEVAPPEEFAGTPAVWATQVLQSAMPPLVGCPADEDARSSPTAGATRAG